MGNKTKKPTIGRRIAATLGVLGALVMSSGVALMVTAPSANATENQKVVVCKYVSTPGGNLDHIVVVADDTLPEGFTGEFPFEWTDAHGQSEAGSIAVRYATEGEQAKDVPLSDCPGTPPPPPATCPEDATAHAGEVIPEGETAESYCVAEEIPPTCPENATANAGLEIPAGQTEEQFCNAVVSPPTPGVVVSPPKVHTPKAKTPKAAVSTPTVVHAGLASVSAQDLRGEQGLALMVAGMVMLVGAGGLGLRLRGVAARI